ncbi:MAG TPA: magnesium transporter [Thermoanaerobaculia bacterium]|nr:magnesium transporter [Thermoanaerobaculia bacterium]
MSDQPMAISYSPADRDPEGLLQHVMRRGAREAADLLTAQPPAAAAEILEAINPAKAQDILDELDPEARQAILAVAPKAQSDQWVRNGAFGEGTVGRLMEPPTAIVTADLTVAQATERVRALAKKAFVTYLFVVDADRKLIGVVTMRDLLLSEHEAKMNASMLTNPFFLRGDMDVLDAMKLVVNRHFPVYPVCDADGKLIGQVRGATMFEAQAIEISAQAGTMVGVDKEERLSTPWPRSLKFRHPWLQLNLLTAFVAAFVVGVFQETIDQIVVLAVFLPVLAGQSGNTGCQALAVALRGMTLGELKPGKERALVFKEGLLGLLNGGLVGVSAAVGMYLVARAQSNPNAIWLAFIVFCAMIGSCVISGVSGAMIPLTLRRLGADPATASSIFLTTATDVASMGIFLGLATMLLT